MNKHTHALALAALLSACGGGSASSGDNVMMNRDGAATAPADTTTKPAPPPSVTLGRTGVGAGFEFTVKSVEQRATVGASRRAGAGETFVVVKFDFKNTANEPVSRTARPEMKLVDGQGRSYSDDGAAGLGLTGLGDATTDTNPGMVTSVSAVWKVDKASFDAGGWKLVLATDPALTFALK